MFLPLIMIKLPIHYILAITMQKRYLPLRIILIIISMNPRIMAVSIGGDVGFTYIDYGNYDKENGEYFQKIAFLLPILVL